MRSDQGGKSLSLYLLPILVLIGLILLFFNKMAFSNLILARGDTFLYFYPYWNVAAEALQDGRIPFWNQNIFMGAPFIANSQVGFFYPLNWPFWWFFETPYAVSASIIFHLFVAGLGTYFAGIHVIGLGRTAAFLAAVSFSLGGYLTAQVEHINQFQGLSWLPWFLLAVEFGLSRNRRNWLISGLSIALLFSLQLLAGHTQSTFITGIGLIIWIIARLLEPRIIHAESSQVSDRKGTYILPFIILFAGALLALVISAVQLFPTYELSQLSSRQGGLPANEVLSFSLPLQLLTRTLLPAIDQSIFSEYVAFLPLLFLALAFIGAWHWRIKPGVFPALIWTFVGFLLALGVYNPIYWVLARIPVFNLFRVPARWMILYALGISLLIGIGWQLIFDYVRGTRRANNSNAKKEILQKSIIRPLLVFLIVSLLLTIWGVIAQFLSNMIPTGPEAPFEMPNLPTLMIWAVEWLILAAMLIVFTRHRFEKFQRWIPWLFLLGGFFILFLGSRTLPFNNLTTPEAYFDQRPPVSRLLAERNGIPQRFLSLSDIFFDSGDQIEIDTIYNEQLPVPAQYDYTIAIKQKEIIAPNLPMNFGLSSVDGFDGGILPLQSYSQMIALILPEGVETTDGRLREHLNEVPEGRWLDLFGAQYLITDKIGDLWRDGIFYDRQHPVEILDGEIVSVAFLPDFEATELRLLAAQNPGSVTIETLSGDVWKLMPNEIDEGLFAVTFPLPAKLKDLQVGSCPENEQCILEAVTLIDGRDGSFQAIVPGNYRMIYSGDVKIYENLDVLPKTFIVYDWQKVPDTPSAIELMDSPDFDVRNSAVLVAPDSIIRQSSSQDGGSPSSKVEIERYEPERVVLKSSSSQDGLLLLTDSYYPGWKATVDGQEVPIHQADGLFRGVLIPAGQHDVVFDFDPQSYNYGRAISLVGLAIIISLAFVLLVFRRMPDG